MGKGEGAAKHSTNLNLNLRVLESQNLRDRNVELFDPAGACAW